LVRWEYEVLISGGVCCLAMRRGRSGTVLVFVVSNG
jgi:hypothetical protein